MRVRLRHQWEHQYRKWLFGIGLIGSILSFELDNFGDAALFATAVIVFWYARETLDLKQITNKQLFETRRQLFFQARPYLHLQWHEGKNKGVYNIINEGEGMALDVVFEPITFEDDTRIAYQIKSRPLIARSKSTLITTDELATPGAAVKDAGIKDYLRDRIPRGYYITAAYRDADGRRYRVVFRSDPTYHDQFRIVEQGRLNNGNGSQGSSTPHKPAGPLPPKS